MIVYRFNSTPTNADGGRWEQVTHSGPFAGATWDKSEYYSTIRLMPIGAAGKNTMQLVGRGPDGLHVFRFDGKIWHALPVLKALSDAHGFDRPVYAHTLMSWGTNLLFAPGPRGVEVFRYAPRRTRGPPIRRPGRVPRSHPKRALPATRARSGWLEECPGRG